MMTFQQTLDYLYERLPMFQRMGAPAIKKDLGNTLRMLEALENPHHSFKSIHIAGTNGKGTSAHALSSILMASGYKTGLYTSPHLKSFTERIRVNGTELPEDFVTHFVHDHQSLIEAVSPSFFEVTVVMAFEYFRQQNVAIAVVETGLGGRLDSTNVITPEASLITMIGWDHSDLLGDSLEKIAAEKAGIIKEGTPVVIGACQPDLLPVFKSKAASVNAKLFLSNQYVVELIEKDVMNQVMNISYNNRLKYKGLRTDLTAGYFRRNIPGILTTIDVLRGNGWNIDDRAIYDGFAQIKALSGLKGRWQILDESPFVIADVSHNAPGLESLLEQVLEMAFDRVHFIFGVVKDKDLSKILPLLPPDFNFYFTESRVPRSMKADELKEIASHSGLLGEAFLNVNDAIRAAKKNAMTNDLILICGSTFVVAEIEGL